MPRVNVLLLVGVLLLVMLFRSSSALASAYGIAVTGTMVVTGLMAIVVIAKGWRWPLWAAIALMAPFLLIDLTFLGANLLKVFEGGWMPLALGALVMVVMYTWRRGSRLLVREDPQAEVPLDPLVATLERKPPQRVPGTAVFFTSDPTCAPTAMMHSLKHYKVLHEKNVILTIEHARRAARRSGRARADRAARRDLLARAAALRLHGNAQRAEGAGHRPPARLAVRHHVDVVFPVAPRAQARRAFRHAALAGPAVHRARPQRQRRHRLFPDSDRAGGRGRNPGDDLT